MLNLKYIMYDKRVKIIGLLGKQSTSPPYLENYVIPKTHEKKISMYPKNKYLIWYSSI